MSNKSTSYTKAAIKFYTVATLQGAIPFRDAFLESLRFDRNIAVYNHVINSTK